MKTSNPLVGRRTVLALLVCLAVGSAAGLAGGLVSCSPFPAPAAGRPLSAAEAERLAAMRVTNHRDARVGVRAILGPSSTESYLTGWADWNQKLIYLAVTGPGAGAHRGLLQARPGVIATRPAGPGETRSVDGLPPAVPPSGGWRLHPPSTTGTPAGIDALVGLIFAVAHDQSTTAESLARSDARWLGRDHAGQTPVDVLLGPALPPPSPAATPTSLAALGGEVRYWLDAEARLHRFEALLAGGQPVRVDLDRTDQPELIAIDQLGGRPVKPRAITAAETGLLSRMTQRLRAERGARVRLTVPTAPPAANLRGAGWVDWRNGISYLIVRNLDDARTGTLMRATHWGVASRTVPPWAAGDAMPPLPPPSNRRWTYTDWSRREDALGGLDVDLLIHEALSVGDGGQGIRALRRSASWLRADTVDGTSVNVFEIPKAAEAGAAQGQARLRYWVDRTGLLRRLELRTRIGGYAHLDLAPAHVPYIGPVPT